MSGHEHGPDLAEVIAAAPENVKRAYLDALVRAGVLRHETAARGSCGCVTPEGWLGSCCLNTSADVTPVDRYVTDWERRP